MKLDILAIGAHPDDVELGCGGTLAKEIAAGKRTGIIDLTRGELGTRGSAEIRKREAKAAAGVLGVIVRDNMNFPDGFLVNDKAHQLELVKMIRKYRPEIVFANAIDDRHPDHAKGSKLVSDACFLSGLVKIKTELEGEEQLPWRPRQVLHYIQWKNLKPDVVIDISGFIDKKMEAVLAYKSQFYNPDSNEPDSPISGKSFIETVKARSRDLGMMVGTDYAEGFTTERPVAVRSTDDLI